MAKRPRRHSKQRLAMLAMLPDRCRAHARSTGKPCVAKAMANGRCKNHGGMCTGAKTPEGRARISAAQTRRWEAYRERMGGTKPAPAPVTVIPEPPTDILQRLMKTLMPAKAESATEKWLREELESSNTPRRPLQVPEQRHVVPPEVGRECSQSFREAQHRKRCSSGARADLASHSCARCVGACRESHKGTTKR